MERQNLIIAITGASGAIYAGRLLHSIPGDSHAVHLVASEAGRLVYEMEMGRPLAADLPSGIRTYDSSDFTAPFASGSFPCAGMAIVPCTMGTLGAIASGLSQNLIHRAADVCLKERRPLVLVPRETPLNRIHLSNMLRASEAGAIILPAMPGYYHNPARVEDLADFIVARILEQFGIPQNIVPPWEGPGYGK
ncbi:MAG: UbiX family flavin prenyltransferase [Desulfobacteraceae bacterium]|nr:UbiX family flavin prenyltransferase [Desulfobacteraceae bacterium]